MSCLGENMDMNAHQLKRHHIGDVILFTVQGKKLPISDTAAKILDALYQRKGDIVTYDELFKACGKDNTDKLMPPNYLRVYMTYIRKAMLKMGVDAHCLITCVDKKGYVFYGK